MHRIRTLKWKSDLNNIPENTVVICTFFLQSSIVYGCVTTWRELYLCAVPAGTALFPIRWVTCTCVCTTCALKVDLLIVAENLFAVFTTCLLVQYLPNSIQTRSYRAGPVQHGTHLFTVDAVRTRCALEPWYWSSVNGVLVLWPARARLLARNGLVNKVKYFRLITQKW